MNKKILIVDDLKSWVMIHKTLLKHLFEEKVEIQSAVSAKEALNVLKENIKIPFDLILTDLQMESDFLPKSAGEWLIEETRQIKEYSDIPIVIISAMTNIESIAKKHKVEYIPKNQLIKDNNLLKLMTEKYIN